MPDSLYDALFEPANPRERVHRVASRSGINPDIADDYLRTTKIESGHNVNVRNSSKGAIGFGQVMPDVKGGSTRTVGGRSYNLKDPDQNIEAGLRYFAEGGSDPVARRLHYFGGPRARQRYEKSGRIPNISDGNMTAAQYVQATGGTQQQRPPANPYDALFQDSGQTPAKTELSKTEPLTPPAPTQSVPTSGEQFDTRLSTAEERQFRRWKQKHAPNDSGADYDLRGAFRAGLTPDPKTGHWPDRFKKPNHPTFSTESQYATGDNASRAGRWEGDKFISPTQSGSYDALFPADTQAAPTADQTPAPDGKGMSRRDALIEMARVEWNIQNARAAQNADPELARKLLEEPARATADDVVKWARNQTSFANKALNRAAFANMGRETKGGFAFTPQPDENWRNLKKRAQEHGIDAEQVRREVSNRLQLKKGPEPYSAQSPEGVTQYRTRLPKANVLDVDNATQREVEQRIAEAKRQRRVAETGWGEYLGQVPKSAVTGFTDAAATGLKSIAVLAKKIDDVTGLGSYQQEGFRDRDGNLVTKGRKMSADELGTYQLGQIIQDLPRDRGLLGPLASNPDLEREISVGQSPQAIGQVLSFMLGGWATKSPKIATALLGAGMTAGDAYDEVKAAGGTDEDAVNAGLLAGALLGPTELIGMRGAMHAITDRAAKATWRTALKEALREGRRDMVENALQEMGQEIGQGLITGQGRSLEEVLQAGLMGAVGSTVTVPMSVIANRPMRRARPLQESVDVEDRPTEAPINLPTRAERRAEQSTVSESPSAIHAQIEAMTNQRGNRMGVLIPKGQSAPTKIPKGYVATRTDEGVVIHPKELSSEDVRELVNEGNSWQLLGHANPDSAEATRVVVARATVEGPEGIQPGTELLSSYVIPGQEQNAIEEMRAQFAPYEPTFEVGGAETAARAVEDRSSIEQPHHSNLQKRRKRGARKGQFAPGKVEAPAVTPESSATVARDNQAPYETAPATSTVPEWVRENIDLFNTEAERLGIADKIEDLSRQRLTAKQIAEQLGVEKKIVYAVRSKRGIPSMEAKTEFEEWLAKPSATIPTTPQESAQNITETITNPEQVSALDQTPELAAQKPNVYDPLFENAQQIQPDQTVSTEETETILKPSTQRRGTPRLNPATDSLERAIRSLGGIKDDGSGEVAMLKESGARGLVSSNGRSAEDVAMALAELGYGRDVWWGGSLRQGDSTFTGVNANDFIAAAIEDASGSKRHYSNAVEMDVSAEEEKYWRSQMEPKELEQWEASQKFLRSRKAQRLLREVADGKSTRKKLRELRELGKRYGVAEDVVNEQIRLAQGAVAQPTAERNRTVPDKEKPATGDEGDPLTSETAEPDLDRIIAREAEIQRQRRKLEDVYYRAEQVINTPGPRAPGQQDAEYQAYLRAQKTLFDARSDPELGELQATIRDAKRRQREVAKTGEYVDEGGTLRTETGEPLFNRFSEVPRSAWDTIRRWLHIGQHRVKREGNIIILGEEAAAALYVGDEEMSLGWLGEFNTAAEARARLARTAEGARIRPDPVTQPRMVADLEKIRSAIQSALDEGYTSVVVALPGAARHEAFHASSFSHGGETVLAERHKDLNVLTNTPEYAIAARALLPLYLTRDPAIIVEEIAARIADGKYRELELTREQAIDWMTKWFRSFVDTHGDVTVGQFKEMASDAHRALATAVKQTRSQPQFGRQPKGWETAEARGEFQPEFSVEENRVKLENQEAAQLLDKAYQLMGMTKRGNAGIGGVFENDPNRLIQQLEKMEYAGAPELANAVREAAKTGKGKVLLAFGERSMVHERFHESSHAANRYLEDRHSDFKQFENDPTFQLIRTALTVNMHYPDSTPTLVEEAAAYIASGDYQRFGISRRQAITFLQKWFESFIAHNGEVSVERFQEMAEDGQAALQRAVETHKKAQSERTDEGIRGVQEGRESGTGEGRAPPADGYETGREKRLDFLPERRLTAKDPNGAEWKAYERDNPQLRGRPERVTAYRATSGEAIKPGDWIYLRKDLAERHLENLVDRGDKNPRIVEREIPLSAVVTGQDSTEFIYAPGPRPTESEAFKRWFGDSKVVDEDGKPLVVYHGSTEAFDAFELRPSYRNVDDRPTEVTPSAHYFSASKEAAETFARDRMRVNLELRNKEAGSETIRPFYLAVNNPMDFTITDEVRQQMTEDGYSTHYNPTAPSPYAVQKVESLSGYAPETWDEVQQLLDDPNFVESLKAEGYDGARLLENDGSETWAAFEPTQIKSATGNRGTFDPNDPNILMARSRTRPIKLYRGEGSHNKGGSYYTTDREWARQFTQSGRDFEIQRRELSPDLIYKAKELPKAYDEESFDRGLAEAENAGYMAMWVDEGEGQPKSVYVIDKSIFDSPLFSRRPKDVEEKQKGTALDRLRAFAESRGQNIREFKPREQPPRPAPPSTAKPEPKRHVAGERSFPKSAEAAGYQGGTDRDYSVLTNKESLDRAEKEISRVGADRAAADLAHTEDVGAPEIATGILLMQHYERKGDISRAVNVASDVARKLTQAGQTVQAASLISRLSPEGVLLHAQKLLKGQPLAEETAKTLVQQAKAVTDAEKLLAEIQKQRPDIFGPNGEILPRPSVSRITGPRNVRAKIGTLQDRLVLLEQQARQRMETRAATAKAETAKMPEKGQRGAGVSPASVAADLSDLVIIGAAKLARKGITRAVWLAEMAKEAGTLGRKDLRKLYRQSYEMYERERKQFLRESRERGAVRHATKAGEPTPTTADDYDRVIAVRIEAQKAAQRAHRELARTYQDLTRGKLQKIADTAVGLRRANLLTAVKTHLRNITSNIGFTIISEETARPMAALADMVARRTKGTGLRTTGGLSIPAASKALYAAAVKEGPRRAVDIILGREVLPLEGYGKTSESIASKMQLNEADSGFKILDTYINTVFRTLEAEDALFKVYAFRRELADIAHSQARSEHAKDPSVNVSRRAKELQANPTDAMQIEAATYADYATFQNKNVVSSGVSAFKRFTEPVGGKFLVEQIAPFDRTPTNIIARALENSPLGLISAARKYRRIGTGAKTVAGDIAKEAFTRQEQKDFARTFGRASTGTMLAALAMTLAAKGLLSGAADYDDDREEYMRKRRQYGGGGMLRVPGTNKRVSIMDTPVGKSMATAAAMYEHLKNPENSWEQAITKSGRAALNAYLLDQPLIRGLRDLGETKSVGEAAAQYGTTFVPGSQMLKSVAEVVDEEPRQYRGQGAVAQFKTLVPGRYGRGSLPVDSAIDREERGRLGRRALRAFDPFNTTTEGRGPRKRGEVSGPEGWPMQKELDRLGITINPPQRIKPGKYDKFKAETEDEYQARRKAEAAAIRVELQRLEGQGYFKGLSPQDQEAEIRAAIKVGRALVRPDTPAGKRQLEATP